MEITLTAIELFYLNIGIIGFIASIYLFVNIKAGIIVLSYYKELHLISYYKSNH